LNHFTNRGASAITIGRNITFSPMSFIISFYHPGPKPAAPPTGGRGGGNKYGWYN
jgi:hypothetical protein